MKLLGDAYGCKGSR